MIFGFNAAEVFDIAIAIEENGKKFYDQAKALIDDSGVKQLFEELALQEVQHKEKFKSLKADLPKEASTPTTWDPDNKLSDCSRPANWFSSRARLASNRSSICSAWLL